ncbi:MAG TPA: formimidoylglutamate deiminase [Nocardioidaceae bacterium]|nr:formimidoylglutamate deiminase [Nocardioidaceae bacterium]
MKAYWLQHAWLGSGRVEDDVLVTVDGERFADVVPGVAAPAATATRLPGLTVPGFANCHSHAFHRALRGRTQAERGTFWTWREQMYGLAQRLDPARYLRLAHAVYAEMAAAGIACVGEFHYLHHGAEGTPYADPNAMGEALIQAAREAGLRIALLDTCYLTAGIGRPPEEIQRRFSDGDAGRWAERVDALRDRHADAADVTVGAAVHSVRAVPRDQIGVVAAWAVQHGAPLHVHLSEQVAENEACVQACGATPTQVLDEAGALGPRTSAVHATHLTPGDVRTLGGSGTYACLCPTTERDLADGIGPSRALHEAGSALTLGSDSHAVVDMSEEMRAVELDERLHSQRRGHWRADELLTAATSRGHASLGFADAGMIAPGAWADLVTFDPVTPRTAGTGGGLEMAVFAATAADVSHVVASGRPVQRDGVGRALARVIDETLAGPPT